MKVIDLGSSCFISDHLSSYVQSRSYRAPEVILGLPYDQKIDIWSFGCILAELLTGSVLFQVSMTQPIEHARFSAHVMPALSPTCCLCTRSGASADPDLANVPCCASLSRCMCAVLMYWSSPALQHIL